MKIVSLVLSCLFYAMFNVAGASIIKYQISRRRLTGLIDYVQLLLQPAILFAVFLIFLSALVMFKALSVGKLSIVSPLATGINFILTIIVGACYFGDRLSYAAYLGVLFIIIGILLISVKG